jgi:hypothetical protein
MGIYRIDIFILINHNILSYDGYYKIINSANIKKTKPISEKLSQYRYWLSFFYIGRVYDFIL